MEHAAEIQTSFPWGQLVLKLIDWPFRYLSSLFFDLYNEGSIKSVSGPLKPENNVG